MRRIVRAGWLLGVMAVVATAAAQVQKRPIPPIAPGVQAQQQQQPAQGGAIQGGVRMLINGDLLPRVTAEARFVLARDADAETWLKKARDAGARKEWKLAIDTLWRVVDQHAAAVVPGEGETSTSAATAAWRMLEQWPPEALQAYRTLFEPEAGRLLTEAEAAGDVERVRAVARKYRLTLAERRALDLLATWALDSGRPFEAISALQKLEAMTTDEAARRQLRMRVAVAEALAGRGEQARAVVESIASAAGAATDSDAVQLASLRQFVSSAVDHGVAARSMRTWPILLGGGRSNGRMPAVSTTVSPQLTQRFVLPGASKLPAERLRRALAPVCLGPTWQVVTDGRLVFVRTPIGVAALDAATFQVAWQANVRPRETDAARSPWLFFNQGLQPRENDGPTLDGAGLRAVADELSGTIGLAAGIVFVIEQPREIREGAAVFRQLGGVGMVVDQYGAMPAENSLHAYDAATGKLLWTKGADGPPEEALAEAHFFSTPVECGEGLVAPYCVAEEFALAVFARDGRLLRKQAIGTLPSGVYPPMALLQPTVSDGLIYLPTGAGSMIALEAEDLSLRWAASYARDTSVNVGAMMATKPRGLPRYRVSAALPRNWSANPPLVTDELVIVAPPDGTRLFAMDRATGRPRWDFSRTGLRYLIGCDSERVYVSGNGIQAHRLDDGRRVWLNSDVLPSGRPILAGDELIVPTASGLIRLNTAIGTQLAQPERRDDARPFGHLLAWDGSLYNLTLTALERIPDYPRSLAAAQAELKAHPNDCDALLRLAVLESLRGQDPAALELLTQARAALSTAAGVDATERARLESRLASLSVNSRMNVAAAANADERRRLLGEAAESARRPDDVLRVGTAQIELDAEGGDRAAAIKRGLELIRRIGSAPVALEDGLTGPAAIALGGAVERVLRDCSAEQEAAILTDDAIGALAPYADAFSMPRLAARLDLRRADDIAAEGASPESIEFHLRRALDRARRDSNVGPLAANALARLATLHLAPPEQLRPNLAAAAAELTQLRTDYADVRIDAVRLAATDGDADGPITGAAFAERLAQRIPSGQSAATPNGSTADVSKWRVLADFPTLGDLGVMPFAGESPAATSSLAMLSFSRRIVAIDMMASASVRNAWTCDLSDTDARRATYNAFIDRERGEAFIPAGASSGAVAMVPVDASWVPVGMTTGRIMGPPLVTERPTTEVIEPRVVAVDGVFVVALDGQTLAALPARECERPIWRRDLGAFTVSGLAAAGDWAVALDVPGRRALVYHPWSGRLKSQIVISDGAGDKNAERAEAPDGPPFAMAVVGERVLAMQATSLGAWDVSSARPIWTVTLPEIGQDVQKLDARRVGVSMMRGRYAVVNVDDGRIESDVAPGDFVLPPLAAVAQDDLLLMHVRSDSDTGLSQLLAYDLKSGKPAWSRGPLRMAVVSDAMLRATPDVVPVCETIEVATSSADVPLLLRPQFQRGHGASDEPVYHRLTFLDKRTGRRLGSGLNLRGPSVPLGSRVVDVLMFPTRAVVVMPTGYFVVGTAAQATDDAAVPEGVR